MMRYFLFSLLNSCIYWHISYHVLLFLFQPITVLAGDLREMYQRALYNWNLLQYLGRDPASFDAEYRRTLGFSPGGSLSQSRFRTESRRSGSRRSESYISRRSRSSTVQPSQTQVVEESQTSQAVPVVPPTPAVDPSQAPPAEGSGDSGSVSKHARID